MTMPPADADQSWVRLADAGDPERATQVQARYSELSTLPEEERRARLRAMAQAEYTLPDASLRAMTMARLQAYLRMDPEAVGRVVASLDAVMDQLPGAAAMRRVALVQTLARDFSPEDQQRLTALVPGVFGQTVGPVPTPERSAPAPIAREPVKRPWWAFWKR